MMLKDIPWRPEYMAKAQGMNQLSKPLLTNDGKSVWIWGTGDGNFEFCYHTDYGPKHIPCSPLDLQCLLFQYKCRPKPDDPYNYAAERRWSSPLCAPSPHSKPMKPRG